MCGSSLFGGSPRTFLETNQLHDLFCLGLDWDGFSRNMEIW